MIETLLSPFQFEFMRSAFLIALIVSVPTALLSCFLVLKGWALMGDAVSHAVLPGIVLAYILGLPLILGAFGAGMLTAVATGFLTENSRVKQDTVMGVVFSGMFGLGIVLYTAITSDVHLDHILFGNMLGVQPGDRVATLAWNSNRHLELYYAVSGMGAIVHTVNPRLAPEDIAHILNDAGSVALFADPGFAPLLAGIAAHLNDVKTVVLMAAEDAMPVVTLAPGQDVRCYETLLEDTDADYEWPDFPEETASALCYTSGTTGRPKGVLYSHRSTCIHGYAVNLADVFGLRSVDRVMPVVPMFHVNAWGIPYAAPMVGASLVMPGRHLDGPSVHALMNGERVTMSAGVPTVETRPSFMATIWSA